MKINELLPWGAPKRCNTRNGPRDLRTATPTQNFWALWRANKEALKTAGIAVNQTDGNWVVQWWSAVGTAEQIAVQQAVQARRAADVQAVTAAATGATLSLPADVEERLATITPKLLPYQVGAVRSLCNSLLNHNGALDASDTGTGKTYVALAVAYCLGRPIYAVSPIAVLSSWKRAAEFMGVESTLAGCSNYEKLRRGTSPEVSIVEETYDGKTIDKMVWNLPPGTVIAFDECHRMKDYTTSNSRLGMAALRQNYTVLGMSATAADNPMQMKFVGTLTGLTTASGFFPWMMKNRVVRGRFGLEFVGGPETLREISAKIFPTRGSRIRIADLGDQFPETQIRYEAYNLNGAAAEIDAVYAEMECELAALASREAKDRGELALTILLRARQKVELLKCPALVQVVQDAISEGKRVVVLVNFDATLDVLASKLGTSCVLRGGQSQVVREANIATFQADREPLILGNIRVGGVGVSLHGKDRLALIMPTFSGQDALQAFGRVHRAGGGKSIQRVFMAAGTVEEHVLRLNQEKLDRIRGLNDGGADVGSLLGGDVAALVAERVGALVEEPIEEPVEEVELQAPAEVLNTPENVAKATRRAKVQVIADQLTPEDIRIAHGAMQALAAMDQDHAQDINGMGFSQVDGRFGHTLARSSELSPWLAAHAVLLANKYRGQVGDLFPRFFGR